MAGTAIRYAASGKATQVSSSDFGNRLTGSSDLYQFDGRKPSASINFITAHDGFTLCDLVSYNEKHNEANKDDNRDGADQNDSWNMGAEGPTDDENINRVRERQMRNFLATLMLSQGVPMLNGGDDIARSQQGNNNCYCQDNELTWHDWNLDDYRKRMLDFTGKLIHFRLAHPNLHRRKFFQDREIRQKGQSTIIQDIAWFNTDGNQVSDEVWNTAWSRSIAVLLNGQTLQVIDEEAALLSTTRFSWL
jgi:glycogen operon protein